MKKTYLLLSVLALAGTVRANVNIMLQPSKAYYQSGETVSVDVVAVSDLLQETIGALDVIVTWDPIYLNPITSNDARTKDSRGPYAWFSSGFINPAHLNDSLNDGDAMWTGLAQFLNPFVATSQGNVLTTLKFTARRGCHVGHPTFVGVPTTRAGYATAVYSGSEVNLDITGNLTGTPVMTTPGLVYPHN